MEICQIPHVIFGSTSQSSFRFTSIFSAIKHSSSVLSKFKHYRLWLKAIRWRANFWDLWVLRCQNSLNSSCQFWTNKSIPLQILHHSPVSWRIASLYFFSSNIIYFGQRQPITGQILETFECSSQNWSNSLCQFWNDKSFPLQIFHQSSVSLRITPFLFLAHAFSTLDKTIP